MPKLEAKPTWERTPIRSPGAGVDRANNVIRGVVLAQAGPFKTAGRGAFDETSLAEIVRLANQPKAGLKSRLAHPTLSSDGVGKYLGRMKNARLDTTVAANGATVAAVRADLYLNPTSFKTPNGNLGGYVMDLAESDPDAFSSSLVLQADKEQRLDAKGMPARDDTGRPLPPLWRPTSLHASDVVDTGDAVDGFLSVGGKPMLSLDGLPDSFARQVALALDENFAGMGKAEFRRRVDGYLERYLDWRYGDKGESSREAREANLAKQEAACGLTPSKPSTLTGRDVRRAADAYANLLRPAPVKSQPAPPPPDLIDEKLAKARWRVVNSLPWQKGEAVAELNRLEKLRAMTAADIESLTKRQRELQSSVAQTPYGSDGVRMRLDADLLEVEQTLAELVQ